MPHHRTCNCADSREQQAPWIPRCRAGTAYQGVEDPRNDGAGSREADADAWIISVEVDEFVHNKTTEQYDHDPTENVHQHDIPKYPAKRGEAAPKRGVCAAAVIDLCHQRCVADGQKGEWVPGVEARREGLVLVLSRRSADDSVPVEGPGKIHKYYMLVEVAK